MFSDRANQLATCCQLSFSSQMLHFCNPPFSASTDLMKTICWKGRPTRQNLNKHAAQKQDLSSSEEVQRDG